MNNVNGDLDEVQSTVEKQGEELYGRSEITLEVTSRLPAGGSWQVKCTASGAELTSENLRIEAIQVGGVSTEEA